VGTCGRHCCGAGRMARFGGTEGRAVTGAVGRPWGPVEWGSWAAERRRRRGAMGRASVKDEGVGSEDD